MSWYDVLTSPIGPIFVGGSARNVHRVGFIGRDGEGELDWFIQELATDSGEQPSHDESAARPVMDQLGAYFDGSLERFDLSLAPRGTEFQRRVWRALQDVEFGRTSTYGEIAAEIGRPAASRAVGAANGRNPIPVIVPCHRIIGSSGMLTGYASGLHRKRWLLEHEGMQVTSDGRCVTNEPEGTRRLL
jgi:methylated-DNA-[protein]-cysteine S-methyltransferase